MRNTPAVARRKSDEVEWLVDVDQIKAMRTMLDHSSHCSGSPERVRGYNNLVFAGDTPATTGPPLQADPSAMSYRLSTINFPSPTALALAWDAALPMVQVAPLATVSASTWVWPSLLGWPSACA